MSTAIRDGNAELDKITDNENERACACTWERADERAVVLPRSGCALVMLIISLLICIFTVDIKQEEEEDSGNETGSENLGIKLDVKEEIKEEIQEEEMDTS